MKNLLNCHSIGLHSFPLSFENGLYRRCFYADKNHNLWRTNPLEIAIHPHHVDIKIIVLEGTLHNLIYHKHPLGANYKAFQWNSVILNGKGGFEYIKDESLLLTNCHKLTVGKIEVMKACELHTVYVKRNEICSWIIEESVPTCDYFPINYSNHDLSNWNSEGLYIETTEKVKQQYIGKYKL